MAQTDTNILIGRLGSVGLAIESAPGTANTTASTYLNYTDISMRGHHEPIENIAAKTTRIMDKDSVIGKRWSEGDIEMLCDVWNAGYFWKLALGNEIYTAGTPSDHLFYSTVSGNTPLTATLIQSRGTTDVEQYTYAAIDELTFAVSDGLATISASFQAQFPSTGAAQTVTTQSGTVLSFKDYFVQFGNTLTTALAATSTPLSEFNLTIANNLEVIHRSGSSDVSAIRSKGIRVSGSYTLFFDSTNEREAYYKLTKQAMILTASGINNEDLRIRLSRFRLNEAEVSTGLDDFYVVNCDFVAEDYIDPGTATRLIDIRARNSKAAIYA
ncbi:MAG: phage tail tube protein [Actinomycetota bacterium]